MELRRRSRPLQGEWRVLRVVLLVSASAFSVLGAATAAASNPSTAHLDNALQAVRSQTGAPGAQGAVMACGRLVWAGASGVKSTSHSQPVTSTTPFILSSTTKTVTATMFMKLVQESRVSLGTRLSSFYPRLPESKSITMRMLLDNTSGLPDYGDSKQVSSLTDDPSHHWTTEEIISILSKMKPQFAPGTRFGYNNSNWIVLAGIIPRVAKKPLNAYFEQVIARPADMTQSTFTYEPSRSSEFAHPFVKAEDGALTDEFEPGIGIPSSYWGPVWGDGGLASTAVDLAKFATALFDGHLVHQSTLDQMKQTGPINYGLGMFDRKVGGRTWYGHNGSYGGYESENWTDPQRHVTITVTANLEGPGQGVAETIWTALERAYAHSPEAPAACSSPSGNA